MLHMSDPLSLMIHRLDTPIGEMLIVMDHDGYLRAVDWADQETRMHRLLMIHYGQSDFSLKPAHSPSGTKFRGPDNEFSSDHEFPYEVKHAGSAVSNL
jgi:O6-methylguanine-DNA--protein-cysteine methyltransferase